LDAGGRGRGRAARETVRLPVTCGISAVALVTALLLAGGLASGSGSRIVKA
jgi:hypothetical protein